MADGSCNANLLVRFTTTTATAAATTTASVYKYWHASLDCKDLQETTTTNLHHYNDKYRLIEGRERDRDK